MSETEPIIEIGPSMPRVASVSYHGGYEIAVSWLSGPREGNTEVVDLAPVILTLKFYRPLRDNPEMLKTIHLIEDGTAIAWGQDDGIDMAAASIERLAEETMSSADFRAWLERHGFTYDAAAAQLGISRRLVAYYAGKRNVPRYIALACRYLDGELAADDATNIKAPADVTTWEKVLETLWRERPSFRAKYGRFELGERQSADSIKEEILQSIRNILKPKRERQR